MNMRMMATVFLAGAAACAQAQVQQAGDLLVDVKMSSLAGLSNGDKVSTWANAGTLGGQFVPVVSGQGPLYATNAGGVAAVTFAASANSVITNTVLPPASILGSNTTWSAEVWVLNPTLENPEDLFSWTQRGGWVGSANGTCMEIRYSSDAGNAVEHYGPPNIPWNGNVPRAGFWHHMAITRDAAGEERLYLDGALRTVKTPSPLNLRSNGAPFVMGGVWENAWSMLFSGSLAAVRVHSGTLSGAQVLNNYTFERGPYQAFWAGTAGVSLPWSDPANWESGNVAGAGEIAWLKNGGVAELGESVSLAGLYPVSGGLTVSNGAALRVSAAESVYLADGAAFALNVLDGSLRLPGSNLINLYMGMNGGSATVSVGGTGAAALLDVDKDIIVANSAGSAGSMTLGSGAGVYCSNGWFYLANNLGASAALTVNAGTLGFRLANENFIVNNNGARGTVTVNGGQIAATGDFNWSGGTATNASYGSVTVNAGAALQAKRYYASSTAGTNLLYVNGGTLKALDSRTDFLFGLTAAYVQAGGAAFNVPAGVSVTAAQGLLQDPASTGGGLAKLGAGALTLSGANTFAGDIFVDAGSLWLRNASGLPGGYAGAITMTNASASIGYEKSGGAAELLSHMATTSVGSLMLFPGNASDAVDFSTYPGLSLALSGGFTYTGTYTPYGSHYVFAPTGTGNVYAPAIGGASSVEVNGAAGAVLELTGDSSFTGGTVLNSGMLVVSHVNALGDPSSPVTINSNAVLKLNAAGIPASFGQRITADSKGFLLLTSNSVAVSVDLTGRPGIIVGTDNGTLNYGGTITPASDTYRLGGGNLIYRISNNQGLVLTNLTDGPSAEVRQVVVEAEGIVHLAAGNTYSGGTTVTNSGAVFLSGDAGLGAVPAAPDADNIYVNKGVLRSNGSTFSLAANRGLTVGAGGMELHPWSMGSMTVLGDLSGSGTIFPTDAGQVWFGGANNTWNGTLDVRMGTLGVGTGSTFSWNNSAVIAGSGGNFGVKYDGDLTWSSEFASPLGAGGANIGLRKLGAGTLTVDVAPTYTRDTSIEAGTLKAGVAAAVPAGTGKGNVALSAGAQLDVNGLKIGVNGLSGYGSVVDSLGSAGSVTAGLNNASATFNGAVAPSLTFVKSGTGTQTLGAGAAVKDARVEQGALAVINPVAPTGAVTLASAGTLRVTGSSAYAGLPGRYYNVTPVAANLATLSALNAWLNPLAPAQSVHSQSIGAGFDFGPTGASFPSPYSGGGQENFAARWDGRFLAETTGLYGFATASDDGSMVFIDGAAVVVNNFNQSYAGSKKSGSVSLAAGYHEITVAFYEVAGDQGLTVYLTPPGGSESVLPQRLLSTAGASQLTSLSGASGSRLELEAGAALDVVAGQNQLFGGSIFGVSSALLTKSGAAELVLTGAASSYTGQTRVASGALVLAGAAALGPVEVVGGASLSVSNPPAALSFPYITSSGCGLPGAYYNYVPSAYTMYATQAALEAYLATNTPTLIAGSDLAGLNFDYTSNGSRFPAGLMPVAQAYWKGVIEIPVAGSYTFYTSSDDGSMLFIDGATVVNNNALQGVTEKNGTVTLSAGPHAIAIAFYDNGGGYGMFAQIAGPTMTTQLIPNSMLHPATEGGVGALSGSGAVALVNSGAGLRVDEGVATTYSGALTGPAVSEVVKAGGQTLTLTGDNSAFLGAWYLAAGALQVGNGGTSGTLGGSLAALASGTSLLFNRSDDVIYSGAVGGFGDIRSVGAGSVTLAGSMSGFSGTVSVAVGQTLGVGNVLSSGATVTNNGTLRITGLPGNVTGARIFGSGTTVVQDGARLALPAPSGFPNALALQGGSLMLTTPGAAVSNLAVLAGAASGLELAVTNSGTVWPVSPLTLQAGSLLGVGVNGLFGRYVDMGLNNEMFATLAAYDAAVAGKTVQLVASSLEVGERFDFGSNGAGFPGKYRSGAANFCVSWRGKIRIETAGTYGFATSSDDQSMLFIDGAAVVTNNYWQGVTKRTGSVALTAGLHDIAILFGQGGGGYGMFVDITIPGQAEQRLPNSMLLAAPADVPAYTVSAPSIAVTNGPGAAAVSLAGAGTLSLANLWIDTGTKLVVTGRVAAAGSAVTVRVPAEVPYGVTVVADFTATPGLTLDGVTLTAVGTEGVLRYRDKRLCIVRNSGTMIVVR